MLPRKLKSWHAIALFFAFTFVHCLGVTTTDVGSQQDAYPYLNVIRENAGMTRFRTNANLETSASNHALYLDYHNLVSHDEVMGTTYATGVAPFDRAVSAGYPSYYVGENLAIDESYYSAIDSLMSAIYHRFGFLSFDYDEVGAGDSGSTFVFNMGHSGIRQLCEGPAYAGPGPAYTGLCNPDIQVSVADYNNALTTGRNRQPNYVLWPPNGSKGTSPAFFEEVPDPLPSQSVSGYPVSIQFNPAVYAAITLLSFTLVDNSTASPVSAVIVMKQSNDPHGKFTPLEFAFFPQDRLKWNTSYTATFSFSEGPDIVWTFTTKDLKIPIYTINTNPKTINVPAATSRFAVYVLPSAGASSIGSIQYSYPASMSVNIDFEDQNTLLFSVTASAGQSVTVNYQNNTAQFTVVFY